MTHPAPEPAVVVEDVEDLKATVVALTAQLGALAALRRAPGRPRPGRTQIHHRLPSRVPSGWSTASPCPSP